MGIKKLYDETSINNIGLALQEVYQTEDKYYVSQMAAAVRDVGSVGDKILNNTVTDLRTNVEVIKQYKLYNCDNLETIDAPHLKTIEGSAVAYCDNLNEIKFKSAAFDTVLTLGASSLANGSGSTMTATSHLRWLDVDDTHYIGEVDTVPTATDTITATDPILYGNATPSVTVPVRAGLVVSLSTTGHPYIFDGTSWVDYVPAVGVAFTGTDPFHSTRIRDIGFKVTSTANTNINFTEHTRIVFLVIAEGCADQLNSCQRSGSLKGIFIETSNGDLSDELPFTSLNGTFYLCSSLQYIKLPLLESAIDGVFRDSGIKELTLPKLTTCGRATNYQFCYHAADLESVSLGDGSGTLTVLGTGHFSGCTSLYDLTLNYSSMVSLDSTQAMSVTFASSPIYQFLGTTTTEIISGAAAGDVVINGSTVSTVNGNIVTYGGKDWKRVNNKWQEWGENGNKHPVVKVPSSQLSTYQADTYWSVLSPEIWSAIS